MEEQLKIRLNELAVTMKDWIKPMTIFAMQAYADGYRQAQKDNKQS